MRDETLSKLQGSLSFKEFILCLPDEDQRVIREMTALFENLDRQTEKFSIETGLKCKNGCGACCTNPEIETTIAEVLPLAAYLWSTACIQDSHRLHENLENILQAIKDRSSKGVCVFFKPDPVDPNKGRCSIYAYRPGICRLFGFAARTNKSGQRELVTCKVIKAGHPQECKQTQEALHMGLEVPLLSACASSVVNIDPLHGRQLLPINQAIRLAIEKLGLRVEKLKQ